jgi:hypothetical protein
VLNKPNSHDQFYEEAIKAFEEEIMLKGIIEDQERVERDVKEPNLFRLLIRKVVSEYVKPDEVESLKNLKNEEIKFIIMFLVSLVLKNFQDT